MTSHTPYAQIAIPTPLHQLFTYRIPPALLGNVKAGMRVVVPFRKKKLIGFCLGLTGQLPSGFLEQDLKEIIEVKEEAPVFSDKMLEFLVWLADYYMAPIGEVCHAALPAKLVQLKSSFKSAPRLKEEDHTDFHETQILTLIPEQKKALEELLSTLEGQSSKPVLLHGITGSGKTEIYLQFIEAVLKTGRQAILLTPEIGLTPQLIGRVQSRLKEKIAIYHSGLTESQRHLYWEKMRRGDLKVAVGTRSALFAPFPRLGAIIVDEEHDSSYKQGEGSFHYHARDAATVRAKLEQATVVLGSATPSLESFHNAKKGKYHYIYLSQRATGASLPEITLIDLRQEKFVKGSKTLSPALFDALSENLYRGEQSLLLLNRRGFANFLICQDCGEVLSCPNCAISLTYHKNPASMVCHYCDYRVAIPKVCNKCQSTALKALGEGTQTLEEELKHFFPEAKIVRLDKDTSKKREYRHQTLHQMKKGGVDILLGTQIVSKGHDFPNVTLVGVILADTSLHLPDFRAAERTFQLLTQVAGRSGRAEKPGKVLIQTFHPENFSLECARGHNFETFSQKELQTREELFYPPFSRLAQIRLQSSHENKVQETAHHLKKYLNSLDILGPAKAPIAKVRGKHRWQLLVKAQNFKILKQHLLKTQVFMKKHLPSQVQIQIDVDCLNMM